MTCSFGGGTAAASRHSRTLPALGAGGRSAADGGRCQRRKRAIVLRATIVEQRWFMPALDHAAPLEKREHTHANDLQKLGDICIAERWQAMKRERSVLVRHEYAIEHDVEWAVAAHHDDNPRILYCILYWRLDRGVYRIPLAIPAGAARVQVSRRELELLLQGIDRRTLRAARRVTRDRDRAR